MLSIGEFSRVSELSIKTIRYYHDLGILIPDKIDMESGYRYYSEKALEDARRIKLLKDLGFSLNEVKAILAECKDEEELQIFIHKKLTEVEDKLKEYQAIKEQLMLFQQQKVSNKVTERFEIIPKAINDKLVCSIQFRGRYSGIGKCFEQLYKQAARFIVGAPFALYYDLEYKEDDALIDACVEVRKEVELPGIDCRLLKGGRAVTLIHQGPYGTQGSSYQKLFAYCNAQGLQIKSPICETFLKGPGMIFRGNPQKYLTELVLFINH